MNNQDKPKRRRPSGSKTSKNRSSNNKPSNQRGANNKRANGRRSNKQAVSSLKPEWLVKKATQEEVKPYKAECSYAQMKLAHPLDKNVRKKGYDKPTEIQERCFNEIIEGKNIIGIAATGTGKTAAFLIPIIEQMILDRSTKALVVVPTRELAQQVEEEFRSLTPNCKLSSSCFIGGTNITKDIAKARRKLDLIVGTPGRLKDLMNRGDLKLNNVSSLVIDEFDRMLDMGFVKDIEQIVGSIPNRKQTLFFSATVDASQEKLLKKFIQCPVRINVTLGVKASDNVDQKIIRVKSDENKFDVLLNLINDPSFDKIILFAETKRTVNKLNKQLIKSGLKSDVIHSNKSQNYRIKAIESFKKGNVKILVATDIAARGLDVKDITHVINYQLPMTMDSYIHRIGRTGRAGKTGTAYTFVN